MLEKVCQFDLTNGFQGFLLHVVLKVPSVYLYIVNSENSSHLASNICSLSFYACERQTLILLELSYVSVIQFLF